MPRHQHVCLATHTIVQSQTSDGAIGQEHGRDELHQLAPREAQ